MGDLPGLILMCSDSTQDECLSKDLFPCANTLSLAKVGPRTVLFLYNYSSKALIGTWKRKGKAIWNTDKSTLGGFFAAQLPVKRTSVSGPVQLTTLADVLNCSNSLLFNPELTVRLLGSFPMTLVNFSQ